MLLSSLQAQISKSASNSRIVWKLIDRRYSIFQLFLPTLHETSVVFTYKAIIYSSSSMSLFFLFSFFVLFVTVFLAEAIIDFFMIYLEENYFKKKIRKTINFSHSID